MTEHTPGPWQSQHDFDLSGEFTIIGNVDGEIIDGHTHHTYTTVAEIYDNDNLTEDRANARLIAAAPDLLGQMESAQVDLDLLRRAVEEGDPKAELLVRITDLWKRNAAAISKATGKEPHP